MVENHGRLVIFLALTLACNRRIEESIADSHISANVPANAGDFDRFLKRDLQAYFLHSTGQPGDVEYSLLRDVPTQVGVADPKFYVWVRVSADAGATTEGAARVAAVERDHFEVLRFLTDAEMRADPALVRRIFPGPVYDRITEKLGGH
jgi:hypothetical protein